MQKETKEKRSATVSVMLTPTVRSLIERLAKAEDRSLSWVTSKLLDRGVEAYNKDGQLYSKGKAAGSSR